MKQTIRQSVFETNSSSMHSLVVSKEIKNIDNIKSIEATIEGDEYCYGSWLDTPEEILSYIWTGVYGSVDEFKLKRLFPNVKFVPFDKSCCCIDHQSYDLPSIIMEQSDEAIYNAVANGILYLESDGCDNRIYSIYDSEILYDVEGVHERDHSYDSIGNN